MDRNPPAVAPGLYDRAYEHDACGIGVVARLHGGPTHEVVEPAILAVEHLYHRGATGADADTGDGAGILFDVPDAFLREATGLELPPAGQYGLAMCFLPTDDERRAGFERLLNETVEAEGQRVLGWRDVPIDPERCGRTARAALPVIRQLLVGASDDLAGDSDAFERKLYVIRRMAEIAAGPDLVIPSFSSRTVVYKGMLTSLQLADTTVSRRCRRPWSWREAAAATGRSRPRRAGAGRSGAGPPPRPATRWPATRPADGR